MSLSESLASGSSLPRPPASLDQLPKDPGCLHEGGGAPGGVDGPVAPGVAVVGYDDVPDVQVCQC